MDLLTAVRWNMAVHERVSHPYVLNSSQWVRTLLLSWLWIEPSVSGHQSKPHMPGPFSIFSEEYINSLSGPLPGCASGRVVREENTNSVEGKGDPASMPRKCLSLHSALCWLVREYPMATQRRGFVCLVSLREVRDMASDLTGPSGRYFQEETAGIWDRTEGVWWHLQIKCWYLKGMMHMINNI